MDEREFYELIKDNVQMILSLKGKDHNFVLREVTKSNNRELMGLTYVDNGGRVAPCFYLNEYYEDYMAGRSISDIAKTLAEEIENVPMPDFDLERRLSPEVMKENVSMKLVGIEGNEQWLSDKVYERYGDFAAVCYLDFGSNDVGSYGAAITIQLAQSLGIGESEFIEKGKAAMAKIEYDFRSMSEVISEMLGMEIPDEMTEGQAPTYVLTTKSKANGSVLITRDDVLGSIAEKVGGDYYVLPSSIHEVLIIPVSFGIERKELSAMVRDVNEKEVSPGDKLSDHVQYYDSKSHKLENAEKRERRLCRNKNMER